MVNQAAMDKHFTLLASRNIPSEKEAFLVLAGERQPPSNIDTAFYRRLCQAVLEETIDQAEIRRNGKPVFWPTLHRGNTNRLRCELPDTQCLRPGPDHLISNSE
jgi:hypothetical protein